MVIIKPLIFQKYEEIIFGFNTKIDKNSKPPYCFNLSFSVGDNKEQVEQNRKMFFAHLGLGINNIVFQQQIHSDIIKYVDKSGNIGECDAMITDRKNLGLAISTADCNAIFLYEPNKNIIASAHSGWRGTSKKILHKLLNTLIVDFKIDVKNLICYLAPSINQKNYEVGEDVAKYFEEKYLIKLNNVQSSSDNFKTLNEKSEGKYLLDLIKLNYDLLIDFGLKKENIQISNLCSYEEKKLLHSYRRDGLKSGRSIGIIAIREN
ncbi:MAG: hypothetical protein STSR0008_01360 [Ignavibacterium sp.]